MRFMLRSYGDLGEASEQRVRLENRREAERVARALSSESYRVVELWWLCSGGERLQLGTAISGTWGL